jgi:pimeloyl-ACP methyl ester carboxylesterase
MSATKARAWNRDGVQIILLHTGLPPMHTGGLGWRAFRVATASSGDRCMASPDPIRRNYSLEISFRILIERRWVGLDTFILRGSSMGGGHSVAYAFRHSRRLEGLILVDTGGANIKLRARKYQLRLPKRR